jgi:hypothetical protein
MPTAIGILIYLIFLAIPGTLGIIGNIIAAVIIFSFTSFIHKKLKIRHLKRKALEINNKNES